MHKIIRYPGGYGKYIGEMYETNEIVIQPLSKAAAPVKYYIVPKDICEELKIEVNDIVRKLNEEVLYHVTAKEPDGKLVIKKLIFSHRSNRTALAPQELVLVSRKDIWFEDRK